MADIFGEDIGDLTWKALGGGGALLGSNIVFPHVKSALSGFLSNPLFSGIAQGATTAGVGILEGEGVKLITSPKNANNWKAGAVLVGFVQALSAVLPGGLPYTVSAGNPSSLTGGALAGILPAASSATASAAPVVQSFAPSRITGI